MKHMYLRLGHQRLRCWLPLLGRAAGFLLWLAAHPREMQGVHRYA